jgi:hypothetical protein
VRITQFGPQVADLPIQAVITEQQWPESEFAPACDAHRTGALAQTLARATASLANVFGAGWADAAFTFLRRPGHHQRTGRGARRRGPRRRQLSAAFRVPPRPRRGHTLVLTADHHAGRCPEGGTANCHPEPAHAGRARLFTIKEVGDASGLPQPVVAQLVPRPGPRRAPRPQLPSGGESAAVTR